jgi:plastocyanin
MRRFAIGLLGCAALVAGCGGDDDGGGGGGGAYGGGAATTATGTPTPATGGQLAVTMRNFAFSPERVDARVGQTVRWTNEDDAEHNVVAEGAGGFRSPNFGKGGTYEHRLTRRGTIAYVCTIHPGMRGRIVVG